MYNPIPPAPRPRRGLLVSALTVVLGAACVPNESGSNGGADASARPPDAAANTGGQGSGGQGSGGQGSGGQATGGQATGGQATGGEATGGEASGGQATGGQVTGGEATGGQATGGQATGGQATGGDTPPADTDGDGLADANDNCAAVPNPSQRDADSDGLGDACDDGDTDHDGVPDNADLCPAVDVRPLDADADGVGDQCDLCPMVPDPAQRDGDGDGLGDACDTPDDDDGDDISAAQDNCPSVANRDQADADADGVGDACDDCPRAPDFSQRDRDEDGIGDACDPCPDLAAVGDSHADADGDGVAACAGDCDDGAFDVRPGASEICDGLDNDCSGLADEPFPGLDDVCVAGVGACARQGVMFCQDAVTAACSAVPGRPGVEICNAVDDDCDGLVDEGVANCCDPGQLMPCGVDEGVCEAGSQTCLPDRTWSACSGRGPVGEICNGLDDDCDGTADNGLGVVGCGFGRCAHQVAACDGGVPGACNPFEGSQPEACNGLDDDCNGVVDDNFDLQNDPSNCGRCGQACNAGVVCANGRCGGQDGVMRCGFPPRDVRAFFRGPAAQSRLEVGCLPGLNTGALLVARSGVGDILRNPEPVRLWLEAGGTVIGEYDTAVGLAQALLGVQGLVAGGRVGACSDEVAPAQVMHVEDPFWRASGLTGLPAGWASGCGLAIPYRDIPGFVPLGGPNPMQVTLGYVEVGRGRLWLVESTWGDNGVISNTSLDFMAWMIAGWAPTGFSQCADGFDNDGDGDPDLWDTGCTGPADNIEGAVAAPPQCDDGLDNDVNGSIDFPYDPGCAAAGDTTERFSGAVPRCFNGIDDDGDGLVDFPEDAGCAGAGDDNEDWDGRALACDDGLDNDRDSFTDYPFEPQCDSYGHPNEGVDSPELDFTRILEDVPVDALADWRLCHIDTYDVVVGPVADLVATCDGAEVLLACRPTGSDVLTLAAAGPRADVFFDTGSGINASHTVNDIQFYFDGTSSIGFAPAGAEINRNTCDFLELPSWNAANADFGTGRLRMCWHTSGEHLSSGFRCGLDDTFGNGFERLVYTR